VKWRRKRDRGDDSEQTNDQGSPSLDLITEQFSEVDSTFPAGEDGITPVQELTLIVHALVRTILTINPLQKVPQKPQQQLLQATIRQGTKTCAWRSDRGTQRSLRRTRAGQGSPAIMPLPTRPRSGPLALSGRLGAQPQRDVGGLHRFIYHAYQVASQCLKVRLVPQPG
jgi:hypothetical protein